MCLRTVPDAGFVVRHPYLERSISVRCPGRGCSHDCCVSEVSLNEDYSRALPFCVVMEAAVGKVSPFTPIALVVEDDEMERDMVVTLLQESEMGVVQCDRAEAAFDVLEKMGGLLCMMFTDVNLAGQIDGVELAHFARQHYPNIHVVVTSGLAPPRELPDGTTFMPKPWVALDLLREAERSRD